MRKLKHQQYSAKHLSRAPATTKRKFGNNNTEAFVVSTTIPRNRLFNNSDERQHRQRTFANAPSSRWNRRRQQQWHHQYQQKTISKNIIIETWKKVFGGAYFASIQKNKSVSVSYRNGVRGRGVSVLSIQMRFRLVSCGTTVYCQRWIAANWRVQERPEKSWADDGIWFVLRASHAGPAPCETRLYWSRVGDACARTFTALRSK